MAVLYIILGFVCGCVFWGLGAVILVFKSLGKG